MNAIRAASVNHCASAAGPAGRLSFCALRRFALLALAALLVVLGAPRADAASQRAFASPEDAVAALMQAVQADDGPAVMAVLGPAGDWIRSGDRAADHALAQRFLASYKAKHAIQRDGDSATLLIGEDDYPFAFPIVRNGAVWRFDTAAGKEQLLARRIGGNELSTIQVLRAIVDAEREYASVDRDGNGSLEYAQKFASSPGRKDGLYWPTAAGEPPSPLGDLVARAAGEGYRKSKDGPTPYHGYTFRFLSGIGKPGAPGAVDFVVRRKAIGGFAVLACPARYGNTGIMSFVVDYTGRVMQADLGAKTAEVCGAMKRFVPGAAWSAVSP